MVTKPQMFIAMPTRLSWIYDEDRPIGHPRLTLTTVDHDLPGDPVTIPITPRAVYQLASEHLPAEAGDALLQSIAANRSAEGFTIDLSFPASKPLQITYGFDGAPVAQFRSLAPTDPRVSTDALAAAQAIADSNRPPALNKDWLSYMRGREPRRQQPDAAPLKPTR